MRQSYGDSVELNVARSFCIICGMTNFAMTILSTRLSFGKITTCRIENVVFSIAQCLYATIQCLHLTDLFSADNLNEDLCEFVAHTYITWDSTN